MCEERYISYITDPVQLHVQVKVFSLHVKSYTGHYLLFCVLFIHLTDGVYLPVKRHDAIPLEDVQWLAEFMNGDPKVPFSHAIHILRRKNYPFFYDPHPWIAGILQ